LKDNTIIEISGLSYTYPDGTNALNSVSCSIGTGEKVAVIGPNGAGKSTLLLTLIGVLKGSGMIKVGGIAVGKKTLKEIRRMIGFVFQEPEDQLFSLTVFEDVAFGPAQFGIPLSGTEGLQRIVSRSLEIVGLPGIEHKKPIQLSSGEKKLVSLATALALEPKILILDEPSSNLDSKHRRRLLQFLQNYDETILIATHDLDFAAELCERCIVLHEGTIKADGAAPGILTDQSLLELCDLELPLGNYFPLHRTPSWQQAKTRKKFG